MHRGAVGTRALLLVALLLTAVAALGLAASSAGARGGDPFAVNGDLRIGDYSTWKRGGKLSSAICGLW